MRIIKRLAIAVILLIMLIPVGGFVALSIIDINSYKPQIVELVEKHTGRKLTINSKIKAVFGLRPTVEIRNVTLSNAEWGKQPYMAKLDKARISINLIPLLKKEIFIDELLIDGATVNLETSPKDLKNWEFSAQNDNAESQESDDTKTAVKTESNLDTKINKVALYNVKINYADKQKHFNAVIKTLKLKDKDGVNITSEILIGKGGNITAKVEIDAVSIEELAKGTANIKLDVTGKKGEKLYLSGNIKSFVEEKALEFAIKATGNNLQSFDAVLKEMNIEPLPKVGEFDISANIGGTLPALEVKELSANIYDMQINANLLVKPLERKPYIKGEIVIATIDAIGNDASPHNRNSGESSAKASTNDNPMKTENIKVIPDAEIDLSALHSVNADVNIKVNRIVTTSMEIKNLNATAILKNASLHVNQISADMLGGRIEGRITVNALGKYPKFNINMHTKDIVMGDALKIAGVSSDMQGGEFKTSIDVTASGNSIYSVLRTLKGHVVSHMEAATYKKPPKAVKAADFIALLRGKSSSQEIKIACYASKFNISEGIMRPEYMSLDAAGAYVEGSGKIDLPREKLGLVLSPYSKTVGLADLTLPMKIGGSFANPKFYPDPKGSIVGAGKVALALTGVPGIAAIAGKAVTDKVGITGANANKDNPCKRPQNLSSSSKGQSPTTNTKNAIKSKKAGVKQEIKNIEKNIRNLRDNKKQELKDIKNELKNLKNLF